MRAPLLLLCCSAAASPPAHAYQGHSLPPVMQYGWGGETRQVFTRDVGGQTLVWTVGDGGMIRHAVDPVGDDWTYQSPPADVTQTLLDVYFLPDGLEGWACGVGGNVIWTTNGGTTWQDQDPANPPIENVLNEPATLWRTRFNKSQSSGNEVGFANGLFAFKRWNGSVWNDIDLRDESMNQLLIGQYEFYALALSIDPSNSDNWIALAAGQQWDSVGGGSVAGGNQGEVFFASSSDGGVMWKRVFSTFDVGTFYDDPWDLEFEPSPANYARAAGYLCGGGGTNPATGEHSPFNMGYVYRFVNGGGSTSHWGTAPELSFVNPPPGPEAPATLYGVAALNANEAVAVGYGGRIWYRSPAGVWSLRSPAPGCGPSSPCSFSAPLAAAHATAAGDTYASGSWGFVRRSPDGWLTEENLNTSSSGDQSEHLRLFGLHFTSTGTGYAVGQKKAVAVSIDGGVHFDLQHNGPFSSLSKDLVAVDFSDDGMHGVACGQSSVALLPFPAAPTEDEALGIYIDLTSTDPNNDWKACIPPDSLKTAQGGPTSAQLNSVACGGGGLVFWAAGDYTDGGVTKPLLMVSQNGGASWLDLNAIFGTIPNGVSLTGIDMQSSTAGVCVGVSGSSTGVAYRIDMLAANKITDVSPVGAGPLYDVAVTATEALAVGDDDQVYADLGGATLSPVAVPHLHPSLPTRLNRVAIAPGGRVLIGPVQPANEDVSPALGKILMRDNGTWSVIRALTDKNIVGLQLLSNSSGWMLGTSLVATGSNPEFGQVDESIVLRYATLP